MLFSAALYFSLQTVYFVISNIAAALDGQTSVESLSLVDMIQRMQWPARTIAIVLAVMSIYSISVMMERWLAFNAASNQSKEFAPRAAAALREHQIESAIKISEEHKRSHLAFIVNAGLQEFLMQQQARGSRKSFASAVRESLERSRALKSAELARGLSGLATIGSTAPFVGLLGTVIGIINAFQGMRVAEGTGLHAVAGGISEALVETSFGLVVAIPAVWAFNHFSNRLEAFRIEMNNSSSELMAYLRRLNRNKAS